MLRSSKWLRHAMALLLLSFALGTVADAGHTHDPGAAAATHAACGYCVAFSNAAGGPAQVRIAPTASVCIALVEIEAGGVLVRRSAASAQPRAPPFC